MTSIHAQPAAIAHSSGSDSADASISDGGSVPSRARVAALTDAVREPVRTWLRSSPSAFLHGSDEAADEQSAWVGDADEEAAGDLSGWAEEDDDPYTAACGWGAAARAELRTRKALVGCSFESHPVTLSFRDRAVERAYQGHSAASAHQSLPRPCNKCSALQSQQRSITGVISRVPLAWAERHMTLRHGNSVP